MHAQVRPHVSVQDKTFDDLLTIVANLYGVKFSYASDLSDNQVLSFISEKNTLSEFLTFICAHHNLEYVLMPDAETVLLRQKLLSQDIKALYTEVKVMVKERSSLQPVELAAVAILGTRKGDYTNAEGQCILHLHYPEDTLLEVSFLGYQSQKIALSPFQESCIIHLDPVEFDIQEVLIKDRLKDHQYNSIFQSYIIRYDAKPAGLLQNDLLRSLQTVSGIDFTNDNSARLRLRGGTFDANMILLDGMTLFNSTHYYGIFSSINDAYVYQSQLYKNNLPVEHGGRTGGLLDISGPTTAMDSTVSGEIRLNNLLASASLVAPLSEQVNISLAARSTVKNVSTTSFFNLFNTEPIRTPDNQSFALLNRMTLLGRLPDFSFYDINGSLQFRTGNHLGSIHFYMGSDQFSDQYTNEFPSRLQNLTAINKEAYSNIEAWQNIASSAFYTSPLSSNIDLETVLSFSRYSNSNALSISLERISRLMTRYYAFDSDRYNQIENLSAKQMVRIQLPSKASVLAGVQYQGHTADINISEDDNNVFSADSHSREISGFGEYTSVQEKTFFYSLGLRGGYYERTDQWYLAPQAQVGYRIAPGGIIKGSVGRQYQFVRELNFENTLGRSTDIWVIADGSRRTLPRRADKIMLGSRWVSGRFSLDIEAYYRHTTGHIELALTQSPLQDDQIRPVNIVNGFQFFIGELNTWGIDVSIDYDFKSFSSQLAYTLSKEESRFLAIFRGLPFPSQNDRRHRISWSNEWRLGILNLKGDAYYASGRAYTDLQKIRVVRQRQDLSPDERLSRLPDYFRMDLSIEYPFTFARMTGFLAVELFNVTNRENVSYIQNIFSIPANTLQDQNRTINTVIGNQATLIPRTLGISVGLRF